jgi:hypothetical protein
MQDSAPARSGGQPCRTLNDATSPGSGGDAGGALLRPRRECGAQSAAPLLQAERWPEVPTPDARDWRVAGRTGSASGSPALGVTRAFWPSPAGERSSRGTRPMRCRLLERQRGEVRRRPNPRRTHAPPPTRQRPEASGSLLDPGRAVVPTTERAGSSAERAAQAFRVADDSRLTRARACRARHVEQTDLVSYARVGLEATADPTATHGIPQHGAQGPQPCTARVDASTSVQIVQFGRFGGRIGRSRRSGCCHGCCQGARSAAVWSAADTSISAPAVTGKRRPRKGRGRRDAAAGGA